MALKKYKPTTPTRRFTKLNRYSLTEYLPEGLSKAKQKKLIDKAINYSEKIGEKLQKSIKYNAGRNNRGVITTRHKGGKVKRKYRLIDFYRDKKDIKAEVVSVDYDPNRSADIALLKYEDGEYRYILAPEGIKLGDEVISSDKFQKIKVGNAHPLGEIPASTFVHNVEIIPGKGGKLARSAGNSIQIQGSAGKGFVQLKMPSGEIRLVKSTCYATIGIVSNEEHKNQKFGKAGRNRKKGIRPTVRGVAQSYKHPHGGGQGKGGRHGPGGPSKDPWGNKRGKITRKRKSTNKYIIKRKTSKLRPRNKPYKTIV